MLTPVRDRPLLVASLIGFGLSLFLIGRLVYSGFSILDDHWIVGWFGSDLHSRIASTEIAQFGSSQRFRPVMFMALILESWLFGDRTYLYHSLQILWFGFFLSAFAWAGFRSVGAIVGSALLFLVADGRYWGNIWTHSLFPSEQIACLGLGLVIFGYGLVWSAFVNQAWSRLDRAAILVGAGTLICVGSKENFLPLVPMGIVLLAVLWRRKAIGKATMGICLCLVALQLPICYGIIAPNIARPTDMYGNDNSFSHRLAMIFHTKRYALRELLALAGGAATWIWAWSGRNARTARGTRELMALSFLLLASGVYACWEQFFYVGQLPSNTRYDFPALLVDPILAGAAFYVAMRVRDEVGAVGRQFGPLAVRFCVILLMIPVAVESYDHDRLLSIRSAVRISNEHTGAMARDLGRMRSAAQMHPDWPILVRADYPLQYEAVVTLPLWLKHFGVANPASVVVDVAPREINSRFYALLVDAMRDQSKSGSPNGYRPRSAAVDNAQAQGHCYMIEFNAAATPCVSLPYHPGEYYPVETF